MSMFTLAISCLTTSNLPWFMDLTFPVPISIVLYNIGLYFSPVTSTTGCCFCFGSISSFFLELLLHQSTVAYWHLPTWGVHLSMFYLFAFSYSSWVLKSRILVCHFPPHLVPPTLQQATTDPHLRWRHLDTQGNSGSVLLWGSLLHSLGSWCTQGFVCVLQESVSQVLCKVWWLCFGLMVTYFKRAYAIPRSTAPRAPAPAAGYCWPIPPQETLKHSKAGLAHSLWVLLVCTRFCLSPPSISGRYGVWF